MSKDSHLRTCSSSQDVKGPETLLKLSPPSFHHIVLQLWQKLSFKMSALLISDILGLFVNTLTSCHKYSLRNTKNLPQRIEMQLSKNRKKLF